MGQIKNIKLHIVTDIKNIQCHNNNNNTKWYNAFSQDVHHQAETRTCNEQESTCATVGEDENWKQNPLQRQEKTLEKNKARIIKQRTVRNRGCCNAFEVFFAGPYWIGGDWTERVLNMLELRYPVVLCHGCC